MKSNSKISIHIGSSGSDCTAPYYIYFNEPTRVGEFIQSAVNDPIEYGTITVYDKEYSGKQLGYLTYEYGSKIPTNNIPNDVYDMIITKACGSGGWGRSDFDIVVNSNTTQKSDKDEIKIDIVNNIEEEKPAKSILSTGAITSFDTNVSINLEAAKRSLRVAGYILPSREDVSNQDVLKVLNKFLSDYGITIKGL